MDELIEMEHYIKVLFKILNEELDEETRIKIKERLDKEIIKNE